VIVVGIDPGVTGALAVHDGGVLTAIHDLPVLGGRVDGTAMADLLLDIVPHDVFLENTQPMPKNGSIASYSLGLNTGIIIGVVSSLSYPLTRVRPSTWKQKMGVSRMDKNAIRGVVRELYPSWAGWFARVKDHDRAEAVLISRYGVTVNMQTEAAAL
jgi:crossover junction endodeoxyribonuclease RuvC